MAVHRVEHGTGRAVRVLHGAEVDHRETEACSEPLLAGVPGLRRVHPDLPGMGRTPAPRPCAAPTTSSARCSPPPTR
ncbi:hypothetical protein ACI8AV_09930 [Geodermatophilus sp. SYSU D00804]